MKVGDLVKLRRTQAWLTEEEWNSTGIILQALTGGSHRKNTSYEVLWDRKSNRLVQWHTHHTLELINEGR